MNLFLNLFKWKNAFKEPDPEYFGWYEIDYDSAKTIKDLKEIMKLSWKGLAVMDEKTYKKYREAINSKIFIKKQ